MKRLFITTIFLAALTVLLHPGATAKSTHQEGENLLILDLEPTASVVELQPRYKKTATFLSETYKADYSFQLLGINWEEELPETTKSKLEIRFFQEKQWTDWQPIESDQDGNGTHWTYILTEDSTAFQYRADLSTADTSVAPKLSNISFDYVSGGSEPLLSKLIFKNDGNSLIERDEWSANENYRLASNHSNYDGADYATDVDEDILEEDPDMEIIETVYDDDDGDELLWPLEYPKEVKKVIVHHTATTDDLDDPEQAIRAIYYYHAMTRGWGDIGYNYIIDQEGNVYEGRYGGEGVVAGHAGGYNTGSVGIALLGNYEEDPVPKEMVQSLTDLIYETVQTHDIDAGSSSRFRGESMSNILGHSDVAATACPGEKVYELLEDIADIVDSSLNTSKHRNYEDDFAFEEVSNLELITLDPMDEAGISIRIRNTGDETWDDDTYLLIDPNGDSDEIVEFTSATMREDEVEPGDIASFAFQAESGMESGLAHFDVSPRFNGREKVLNYIDLGVYVEEPIVAFDVEEEDLDTTLKSGEETTVTIVLENEGNFTWTDSGSNKVQLKRSGSSSLTSSNTLATLKEDEVEPGEEGTFEFEIQAPRSSGTYSLYYYPDVDGVDTNASAYLRVTVTGSSSSSSSSSSSADVLDSSEDLNFMPGESRFIWIQIENTGTAKWDTRGDDAITLVFETPNGLDVGDPYFTTSSISPGVAAKVYFKVTAPEEEDNYTIEIRPKRDGKNLTTSAFKLDISVGGSASVSSDDYENPIRIKLTPDGGAGSPILTSYDSFAVYDNNTLLKTFTANSRVRVTQSGDEFKVTSGSYSWTVDGPVRATPQAEDGLIRVLTMNQLASWDSSINDNKFRGTMEVRSVDNEVILINELPLEDYVIGLAEETNSTPEEKLKAMSILGRTYAYYYMTQEEKFPGMPYHLDDDPATSQKYLGYGYEERHPNVPEAAQETVGTIVTYNGEVVKTPYFSQSDGVATKSAQDVWGWTHTPYLTSVEDTWCDSTSFWGHGVGLSGCGAKAMANAAYSFEEIIEYYYTGVELDEIK
jgi:hypothetical protein